MCARTYVAVQTGIDMKNSKDYSKKVQALYRTLSRKHPKVRKVSDEHVTDAVVYAIVSSELNEKSAASASVSTSPVLSRMPLRTVLRISVLSSESRS